MYTKSNDWLYFTPNKDNFGCIEPFETYFKRISNLMNFSHIPKNVFHQWLYAHNDKIESIKNYGWINYENIEFKLCKWSLAKLQNIHIIDEYKDYFNNRASFTKIDNFCCTEDDIKYWKNFGTWKIPPIILDVNSINHKPHYCELNPPFQLVEGHSRLGYLHSMISISIIKDDINLLNEHEIYLMSEKRIKL